MKQYDWHAKTSLAYLGAVCKCVNNELADFIRFGFCIDFYHTREPLQDAALWQTYKCFHLIHHYRRPTFLTFD